MTNDYYKPFERDLLGDKKPEKRKFKKREGVQSYEFFKQLRRRTYPNESHDDSWNEYLKYLDEKGCLSPNLKKTIK